MRGVTRMITSRRQFIASSPEHQTPEKGSLRRLRTYYGFSDNMVFAPLALRETER